jgi:hypothetical protein
MPTQIPISAHVLYVNMCGYINIPHANITLSRHTGQYHGNVIDQIYGEVVFQSPVSCLCISQLRSNSLSPVFCIDHSSGHISLVLPVLLLIWFVIGQLQFSPVTCQILFFLWTLPFYLVTDRSCSSRDYNISYYYLVPLVISFISSCD